MDVGLLSMQRVANYGSFWQAYCLKNMIADTEDCSVDFIDIIPGEIDTRTVYKKSFSFAKVKRIPYYFFQQKKRKMFADYQTQVLMCSHESNYRSDYDAIIIGSDEVFNFVQDSPWGFSPQLYGRIDNSNVNSYAACFGNTTLEEINKTNRKDDIAKGLGNIKHISVRDENSYTIVKALTDRRPEVHLDPVIVGNLPPKLPVLNDNKYILVYSYDFRMSDEDVIRQTRSFAKKYGYKIISAGFYQDWVDKNILPNPYELLSYFRNAEYVITDTFHGTIFSARMHKKFVTVIRNQNQQKLGDLLKRIGMDNRQYKKGDSLIDIIKEDADYDKFERMRNEERGRSITYLGKCLLK